MNGEIVREDITWPPCPCSLVHHPGRPGVVRGAVATNPAIDGQLILGLKIKDSEVPAFCRRLRLRVLRKLTVKGAYLVQLNRGRTFDPRRLRPDQLDKISYVDAAASSYSSNGMNAGPCRAPD